MERVYFSLRILSQSLLSTKTKIPVERRLLEGKSTPRYILPFLSDMKPYHLQRWFKLMYFLDEVAGRLSYIQYPAMDLVDRRKWKQEGDVSVLRKSPYIYANKQSHFCLELAHYLNVSPQAIDYLFPGTRFSPKAAAKRMMRFLADLGYVY